MSGELISKYKSFYICDSYQILKYWENAKNYWKNSRNKKLDNILHFVGYDLYLVISQVLFGN